MHDKIETGLFLISWLLFWINCLLLILMIIIEKEKRDNETK